MNTTMETLLNRHQSQAGTLRQVKPTWKEKQELASYWDTLSSPIYRIKENKP